MIITVNDEAFELPSEANSGQKQFGQAKQAEATLADLLRVLNIHSADGLALAVNHSVVSRDKWELFSLSENDNVLIITATQGG